MFHKKIVSTDLCVGDEEGKEVEIEENKEKKEENQRFGKKDNEKNSVEV